MTKAKLKPHRMPRRAAGLIRFPLRVHVHKASLLVSTIAVLAIIAVSYAENGFLYSTRLWLQDKGSVVTDMVSRPINAVKGWFTSGKEYISLYETARKLSDLEVAHAQLLAKYQLQEAENRELRKTYNVAPREDLKYKTVRVMHRGEQIGSKFVMIRAGQDAGMKVGMPVVYKQALLGKLVEVGQHASKVLLIQDTNSVVPVMIPSLKDEALLKGNNTSSMRIIHQKGNDLVSQEDLLITSGHQGLFPPGLVVGKVFVDRGEPEVESPIKLSEVKYASVVLSYEKPAEKEKG